MKRMTAAAVQFAIEPMAIVKNMKRAWDIIQEGHRVSKTDLIVHLEGRNLSAYVDILTQGQSAFELATNTRFTANPARVEHFEALEPLINATTKNRMIGEWLALLQSGGISCGPINNVATELEDAHVEARRMLVEITYPVAGTITCVLMKFSETPSEVRYPAPTLGQHNINIWETRLKRNVSQRKADEVI